MGCIFRWKFNTSVGPSSKVRSAILFLDSILEMAFIGLAYRSSNALVKYPFSLLKLKNKIATHKKLKNRNTLTGIFWNRIEIPPSKKGNPKNMALCCKTGFCTSE